jgi:flagellar hook-length control protein FliK
VATLLPLVPAQPAAPPAARPARAAAAAEAGGAGTFDQVLARSAASADSAGAPRSATPEAAAEPVEEPTAAPDGPAAAVVDPWIAAWLPVPAPRTPVDGVAETSAEVAGAPAEGADASEPPEPEAVPEVADRVGAGLEVSADTLASRGAVAADVRQNAPRPSQDSRPNARPQEAGRVAPSEGDHPQPAAQATSAAVATPAPTEAAPQTRSAPAIGHGRQVAGRPRVNADPVNAAARQVLHDALADRAIDPSSVRPTTGPQAVATQALVAGFQAPSPSPAQGAGKGQPADADAAGEWLDVEGAVPATVRPAGTTSRHSGGEQSGRGHEQGLPAFARAADLRNASLPASMAFPGQPPFAAALEQAAPLGPPPSFSSQVLHSVGPQVVRGLQVQIAAGGGDMTLTLNPEHLGTVTIEVKVDQQRVVATLTSDTPAVRGWMAAHEQDLKSGLADVGLSLDELVVREDDRRQGDPREQAQPERRRKAKADEDATFEVLV